MIFQSADFRVTDVRTNQPWDFLSQKSIFLNRFGWNAVLSFVGIGHTGSVDVAEWVASRTALIAEDAPFDELPNALLEADSWLRSLAGRRHHTFTIGAFVGGHPQAVLVSNCESLHARPFNTPQERLKITRRTFLKPVVLITGQRNAVRDEDRRLLEQLLREGRPPLEIHQGLARVNERAARINKTISPGCFTTHLQITGEGEAMPHGLDDKHEYLPAFLQTAMSGLKLNPAFDERGRPKPIRLKGTTFVRFEPTEAFHREQLRRKPDDANTYNNYGAYLVDVKKDPEKALRAYLRALELDPDHALALGNYGILVWRHRGELDEAERILQRAVKADPIQTVTYAKYAEFLCEARGNFDDAEALIREGLAINPRDENLLLAFAHLKAMRREYLESERLFEAYLTLGPRNADTLTNYAAVSYLNGADADSCIALYREALAEQSDLPCALVNLAQLLFCKGQPNDHNDREAERLIAHRLAHVPERSIQLEAWFYRFAHVEARRLEALGRIHSLIDSGVRSVGWNFSCNLQRASREKPQERELLKTLAEVINGSQNADSLLEFTEWRALS